MPALDPQQFLNLAGNAIGGAGTNKHLAGIARLAIIFLALNSQQLIQQNHEILKKISELESHIETNDQRITSLENIVQVAYADSLKALPKPVSQAERAHHDNHTR